MFEPVTHQLKRAKAFLDMGRMLVRVKRFATPPPDTRMSLGLAVERNAGRWPEKTAILFEGRDYSWSELNARANRYAQLLLDQGAQRGDCVAIVMENRFEYLAALTGCAKIGAISGLININQRSTVLIHSFGSIKGKYCIVGEECLQMIADVKEALVDTGVQIFIFVPDSKEVGPPEWTLPIGGPADDDAGTNVGFTKEIQLSAPCYYIFSSGTTGLPKAAVITNERWLKASKSFAQLALWSKSSDRVYVGMPLYHGSAMHIGFGPVVLERSVMFLKRKFSARSFWEDVRANRINTFIYIGELCRYLLNQPESVNDGHNPLTKCVGNGLHPSIWKTFKERFQIDRICEFYASTEGNGAFFNSFNKDETIGFTIRSHVLVEVDAIEQVPLRDDNGFCIPVTDNRPGLLLIEVSKQATYDGYTDKQASERKLLRNVKKPGDVYFNTGDLLKRVDVGFAFGYPHYQFVDRMGDTFRWKGENVSTQEVAGVLNGYPEIAQCMVYGVKVPHQEGKAGMAAVKTKTGALDFEAFCAYLSKSLPPYARPLFIRIVREFNSTATYKLQNREFVEAGFSPERCGEDRLYYYKQKENQYAELKQTDYERMLHTGI
ncbi:long-chain-acyl-CoA synthetase [Paenibacillus tarimensis]|uniref:long-chain-acyl-CoA synthetase n=1 Tax=Paenibacillus tarimensis TaxID=416012 RepID=UPI001F41F5E1|nr:long-chain-acyl-CoA synthetase [Paenibacillus tarimensis]MCF2943983.1 long-chain-acyl-CoA synthetase [Paenibacillus tarimensis]